MLKISVALILWIGTIHPSITMAGEQDQCTQRILAARQSDSTFNFKNDASLQMLNFCASDYESYKNFAGGGAGFGYGNLYGNGNYSQNQYKERKSQICLAQSRQEFQSELNSRVLTKIGYSELRQICPVITFACQFDEKSLEIIIYNSPVDPDIRAYFQTPLVTPGSLRLVKNAVREKQELLRTQINGDGYRVPLIFAKGKENEAGKVTLNVGFGTSWNNLRRAESCTAFRPAIIEPRQVIYTAGSSQMEAPLVVRPTFSRIRNESLDINYEWFSFTTPSRGDVEISLYAQKTKLMLRVHSGGNLEEVVGNKTIIEPGKSGVVSFKAEPDKRYVVGIQAYSGGPTGAQLDVSYAPQ